MDRLQKKCLMVSGGTHSLLLVILLTSSAFFVSKTRQVMTRPLLVVPSRLIDGISSGGGNPNIPQPPEPQKQKGEILKPTPQPPEPKPKPEPKKEVPQPPVKPVPKDPPRKITLDDLKPTVRKQDQQAATKASAELKQRQELARKLSETAKALREGFSSGTVVEVAGPGGIAFADYAQFVREVYDNAWVIAEDINDETATARVQVIIARNGNVVSARILRASGNAALDRSVQRALNIVKFVAPFPQGSKDQERTFIINFNIKSKRGIG